MGYDAISGLGTLLFGNDASKVFGSKPVVPTLPSLSDAQKTAINANTTSFSDIAKLATATNTLNQDQLNALIDKTLGPGVREQFQQNLASQARGEIPQDVQNAIFRGNAERTAGGNAFGGGGFGRNLNARDLGLTSLQITNNAMSSAESWLSKAQAPMFDATSMFITPMQQNAANLDQFNRNLLAAKVAAAPDPAARGVFDSNMALAGMILGVYSGGAGYKGTYDPNAGNSGFTAANGGGGGGMYTPQSFNNGGGSSMPGTSSGSGYAPMGIPENSNGSYQFNTSYGGLAGGFQNDSGGGGGGLGGLAAMFI